jgi:enoyl-[acyl-carrier protein] reductase II
MLAAMVLGADGVQMGTRFAASVEASGHENFKQAIINSQEGDTMLSMKKIVPVRLIKNDFQKRIQEAEDHGASIDELGKILGRSRAKKGMFEGDLKEGELEIGQISSFVREIKPAAQIVKDIWSEFISAKNEISKLEV